MNAAMATTSQRRKCCNDPNVFCYICGNYTLKDQRRNITTSVKKMYLAYLKVHLGEQDKSWVPHIECKTCVDTWTQGKNAKFKFGVPMVWREPTNHFDNCYSCLVNVKGLNEKTKHLLKYQDIPSTIRPVAPVPVFAGLPEIDDDVINPKILIRMKMNCMMYFCHLLKIVIRLLC
ncbi:uncharacterized protein LOC143024889 [Oratosquilla oratoria]|uniref:uncharacterized protein LOC143024889 n=1 Tax=Oratosquilla oratoria TaxID=337810 RepID=UPI003F7712E1